MKSQVVVGDSIGGGDGGSVAAIQAEEGVGDKEQRGKSYLFPIPDLRLSDACYASIGRGCRRRRKGIEPHIGTRPSP